jgi:SAM-dependent methyltransferase
MYKCLICGKEIQTIKNAVISGFLLERIWSDVGSGGGIDENIHLLHCESCGFAYYSLRPNESEMAKLYSGYRSDEWQKQRQKHEPWYSKRLNDFSGDIIEYKSRQSNLNNILKQNVNIQNIDKILDYGGNDGKYIPSTLTSKNKYVFDISDTKPVNGVEKIFDMNTLLKHSFQFIMCCQMLEHVSDPREIILEIKKYLSDEGILYIELPFDSPFYKHKRDYIHYILHINPFLICKRFLLDKTQPYRMREHINFFTLQSATDLLANSGFNIIYANTFLFRTARIGIVEAIGVLAKI